MAACGGHHRAMGMPLRKSMVVVGLAAQGCSGEPGTVHLTTADNGKNFSLALNQPVELQLQTIGPGQFGDPSVSSGAVRFEGVTFPQAQNPGGPTQVYEFRAVGRGTALITIPHEPAAEPFTFTVLCCAE